MVKSLTLRFSDKTFYIIVILATLLIFSGVVVAWNSDDPSLHGHTANEIDGIVSGGGSVVPITCPDYQAIVAISADGTATCGPNPVLGGWYIEFESPGDHSCGDICSYYGKAPALYQGQYVCKGSDGNLGTSTVYTTYTSGSSYWMCIGPVMGRVNQCFCN